MGITITRDGEALPPPCTTPPDQQPLAPAIWEQRFDVALNLRAAGLTAKEISTVFGVSPATVANWFTRARRQGKLAEDLDRLLDKDTAFRALEVLHNHLEEGNLEAALAVLKGRGALRTYTNNNQSGGNAVTGIQIVYTTKDGAPPPRVIDSAALPGQIVGTPRVEDPGP